MGINKPREKFTDLPPDRAWIEIEKTELQISLAILKCWKYWKEDGFFQRRNKEKNSILVLEKKSWGENLMFEFSARI